LGGWACEKLLLIPYHLRLSLGEARLQLGLGDQILVGLCQFLKGEGVIYLLLAGDLVGPRFLGDAGI